MATSKALDCWGVDATDCGLAPGFVLLFTCPHCHAAPGSPCKVLRGGSTFHKARTSKSLGKRRQLTFPVFVHVEEVASRYARRNGYTEDVAIRSTPPLRAAVYSRGADFIEGEKLRCPTFQDVGRIVTDDMLSRAMNAVLAR